MVSASKAGIGASARTPSPATGKPAKSCIRGLPSAPSHHGQTVRASPCRRAGHRRRSVRQTCPVPSDRPCWRRMQFLGKLAISPLDFAFVRALGHAENVVWIAHAISPRGRRFPAGRSFHVGNMLPECNALAHAREPIFTLFACGAGGHVAAALFAASRCFATGESGMIPEDQARPSRRTWLRVTAPLPSLQAEPCTQCSPVVSTRPMRSRGTHPRRWCRGALPCRARRCGDCPRECSPPCRARPAPDPAPASPAPSRRWQYPPVRRPPARSARRSAA